jgi:hypothetical protein
MAYYKDKTIITSFKNGSQMYDFLCSIAVFISLAKINNIYSVNNGPVKKMKIK